MPLKETLKKHFLFLSQLFWGWIQYLQVERFSGQIVMQFHWFFCCNIQGFKLNNKKICKICKHTQGEKKGGGRVVTDTNTFRIETIKMNEWVIAVENICTWSKCLASLKFICFTSFQQTFCTDHSLCLWAVWRYSNCHFLSICLWCTILFSFYIDK